jgi:hypothetical protein
MFEIKFSEIVMFLQNSTRLLSFSGLKLIITAFAISAGISSSLEAIATSIEIPIPRSVPGDKGKYFLLKKQKRGNIVVAVQKRVGVDSVVYTKTETDCATMRMRELGSSEESLLAINENPTKWFELVPGSSKSDLANFICKQEIKK